MKSTTYNTSSAGIFGLEVKKRSDKWINYFLLSYFAGGLVLAQYYDTWLVACGVGGCSLLLYYSAKIALPDSLLYQYILGLVLGIFMAQFIYQMHGLFEMHFIAFIGSAILITYQNWKLQIPLAVFVIIHHSIFGYLQNTGIENIYFTQLDNFGLRTFIIHVLLAGVIFFVCGLWAYQLKKYNEIQMFQTHEMGKLQKEAHFVQELTRFKEALEREKYYLDCLMDNLPDAIYFKDRDSRFMRVSKYMVEKHMTNHPGADINDLLGKTDFDIQNHVHAKEAYDDEQEIIRTREPKIGYIEKELSPDGHERWVTTTKLPLLNGKGEVIGTFGISKDITKLKMLEKQQQDAMLEKAVAQGKFEIASDVMHDIGNAVVGFGSYLTRIRRLQDPGTPEKLKNLSVFFEENKTTLVGVLGEAKTNALITMLQGMAQTQTFNQEEISKIINEQLTNISRIEEILNIQRQYINGHEGQERKPVNITDIINDSFSMTLASADKTGISIFKDIAPDLPLIKGDRTKLMQLMLNIIKNSQEAVEKNDHDKTIFLAAKVCDERLIIQVKDNGHGFDKSAAKKLFTKGFTTKQASSGLGLYNCRIIAESHDGAIDITSEGPGKGAVTTIKFKLN